MDAQPLWTPTQAAEYLSLSPRTLEAKRCTGGGPPYIKLGRVVRYDPAAVKAWVEKKAVAHTSETTASHREGV